MYAIITVDTLAVGAKQLMICCAMIEIIWFVLCLDPVFIYTAVATVSRLRLKAWAEPFAGMNAVETT